MGAGDLDVLFAIAGGACGADVLVGVTAGSDDGGVADAAGDLPGEAGGGGGSGHFTPGVERGDVDGAGGGPENLQGGFSAEAGGDAHAVGALGEEAEARFDGGEVLRAWMAREECGVWDGAGWSGDRRFPVGAVEAWTPPADAVFFPEEPDFAGVVGEEVFGLEAFGYCEFLCAVADDHDVGGAAHDGVSELSRVADAGQGGDGAGAARGAVHDGGVELDDAVFVGETAEADAVVGGIVLAALADVERGFEGVGALGEEGVGLGYGVVAGLAGDDDGFPGGLIGDGCVGMRGGVLGSASGYACSEQGCPGDEDATTGGHAIPSEAAAGLHSLRFHLATAVGCAPYPFSVRLGGDQRARSMTFVVRPLRSPPLSGRLVLSPSLEDCLFLRATWAKFCWLLRWGFFLCGNRGFASG